MASGPLRMSAEGAEDWPGKERGESEGPENKGDKKKTPDPHFNFNPVISRRSSRTPKRPRRGP